MSQIDEDAKDFARMLRYVADCIRHSQEISSLPNCNSCGTKNCKYKPGWGLPVRINCPFYESKQKMVVKQMPDMEKVIKGLECCAARNGTCQYKQEPICPYVEHCQKEDYAALQRDALDLLKEQEAVKPEWSCGKAYCGACGKQLPLKRWKHKPFCPSCGKPVKWE